MTRGFSRLVAIVLVGIGAVHAAASCPMVRSEGEPQGQIKTINGSTLTLPIPPNSFKASNIDNTNSKFEPIPNAQWLTYTSAQIYHTNPSTNSTASKSAILYLSDIYGIPLLQNKLY
jgi:hypothetical protein